MQQINKAMLNALSGYNKKTAPRVEIIYLLSTTKKEYTYSELKNDLGKSATKSYDHLRKMVIELSDAGWININKKKKPYKFKIEDTSKLSKNLFKKII